MEDRKFRNTHEAMSYAEDHFDELIKPLKDELDQVIAGKYRIIRASVEKDFEYRWWLNVDFEAEEISEDEEIKLKEMGYTIEQNHEWPDYYQIPVAIWLGGLQFDVDDKED